MRVTKRQLKRIIAEESRKLQRLREDSVDDELDNLKKNIGDDIEHIRDLKDDIKDDHEEEHRAREEEERKDESISRRKLRHQVRTVLKQQHRRGLNESVADDREFEVLIQNVAGDVAQTYEDMMGEEFFDEDPTMFAGRSTREEWLAQVTIASMELEAVIEDAIRQAIAANEDLLHGGNFHRG